MLTASEESPTVPIAHIAHIEVYIVRDAAQAHAHLRHLHCFGPTNILSFAGGKDMPASLVLSADTFRRECLLYGQPPSEYLVRLLAHGLAHTLGFDHGPAMDTACATMEAAARKRLQC